MRNNYAVAIILIFYLLPEQLAIGGGGGSNSSVIVGVTVGVLAALLAVAVFVGVIIFIRRYEITYNMYNAIRRSSYDTVGPSSPSKISTRFNKVYISPGDF